MTDKATISQNYLALQYLLSDFESLESATKALETFVPLASHSNGQPALPDGFPVQCSAQQVVALLVVSCPDCIRLVESAKVVSAFFSACLKYSKSNKERDYSEDYDLLDQVPDIVSKSFSLPETEIVNAAVRAVHYTDSQATKVSFPTDPEFPQWTQELFEELFFSFCRSRVLKNNSMEPGHAIDQKMVAELSKLPFWSDRSTKWINGFYKPLSYLAKYTELPPLVDFETFMPIDDQVQLIMSAAVENNKYTDIIQNTLLPYLQYHGGTGWREFNQWLIEFGDRTIKETSQEKLVANYKVLLEIVRQDRLLGAISKEKECQDQFVSVVIASVYLCPKAILEVFVDANEMLVSLKAFPLDEGDETSNKVPEPQGTVAKTWPLIPATKTFLNHSAKTIETAERLYANDLSLVQIATLSSSDSQNQLTELQKFVNNESRYGKNSRQWDTLLSSIYWIFRNTDVFDKVSTETLDELILTKLLDLKYFDIISDLFLKRFCTLPEETTHGIIMRYAWQFYKRATNCDPTIGSLKNSLACVNLVQQESADVDRLKALISANQSLLRWKLSFQHGVPVTPKQILDLDDPQKVISSILELNETSYKDSKALFKMMKRLIIGLDCYDKDEVYEYAKQDDLADNINPLLAKVKLMCLDFASAYDSDYAYELALGLLDDAIDNQKAAPKLFDVISQQWFSFFQLVKNEANTPSIDAIDRKQKLLGELILVTPTEFNIPVLEQWQMLNTEKDQLLQEEMEDDDHMVIEHTSQNTANVSNTEDNPAQNFFRGSGLGDLRSRLESSLVSTAGEVQNSLTSSAKDILKNADAGGIGRNIIGRIVGAE